jgi:hypothetical protein
MRRSVTHRARRGLPLVAIFDEVAIRRAIGDQEVRRGQLRRLIEIAEQPAVTMQIVPSSKGAYAGLPGSFTILSFEDDPDVVYTEGHVDGQVIRIRPPSGSTSYATT